MLLKKGGGKHNGIGIKVYSRRFCFATREKKGDEITIVKGSNQLCNSDYRSQYTQANQLISLPSQILTFSPPYFPGALLRYKASNE
jgi:hypothetical protein